jgi:hypothetical protein
LNVNDNDLKNIKKGWLFDWVKEYSKSENEVYKLVTMDINHTPNNFIHGLISVRRLAKECLFLDLVEAAKINKGKAKTYDNVVGILLAHACKLSFDYGYDGFCVFESKTVLKRHYSSAYGAITLSGQRMYFDTQRANLLISKYL